MKKKHIEGKEEGTFEYFPLSIVMSVSRISVSRYLASNGRSIRVKKIIQIKRELLLYPRLEYILRDHPSTGQAEAKARTCKRHKARTHMYPVNHTPSAIERLM